MRCSRYYFSALVCLLPFFCGCFFLASGGFHKEYAISYDHGDEINSIYCSVEFKFTSGDSLKDHEVKIRILCDENVKIDISEIRGKLNEKGKVSFKYSYPKSEVGKKITFEISFEKLSVKDQYECILE
jgi:hypothetical protein